MAIPPTSNVGKLSVELSGKPIITLGEVGQAGEAGSLRTVLDVSTGTMQTRTGLGGGMELVDGKLVFNGLPLG